MKPDVGCAVQSTPAARRTELAPDRAAAWRGARAWRVRRRRTIFSERTGYGRGDDTGRSCASSTRTQPPRTAELPDGRRRHASDDAGSGEGVFAVHPARRDRALPLSCQLRFADGQSLMSAAIRIAFCRPCRRDGSLPFQRGDASAAVGGPGRAPLGDGRRVRRGVRRVGPECAAGERRRRLLRVGRTPTAHAFAWSVGRVRALRARGRAGRALQVRDPDTRFGQLRLKTDPFAAAMERPPETASRVVERHARDWGDAAWMAARRQPRSSPALANGDLRGAPGLLAPRARRRAIGRSDLPRAARATPRGALPPARLHAHRAASRDGASLRRVVGLSGHRLLRADVAVRRRPTTCAFWSTRVTRPASASFSTGSRPTFPKDDFALRRFDGSSALRARGPASGRAPRLGHAHLQLRPRTEVRKLLTGCERAQVWLDTVSRRRAARRCRGVDALPRLQP